MALSKSRFADPQEPVDLRPLIELCAQAGRAIEAVQAARADDGSDVARKGDGSPVTEADLASSDILMAGLARLDPGTDVLCEETYQQGDPIPTTAWVVDPLDGTKEFIKRNGEYVVNLGLMVDGVARLGIVHVPGTGKTFLGGAGWGAWRTSDGRSYQAIRPAGAEALRIVMSRSHQTPELAALLERLDTSDVAYEAVPMGSAWKFLAVAQGEADLYPRLGPTMWWDTLAPQAVAEGAGCQVVDAAGARLLYKDRPLLNGHFHVLAPHIAEDAALREALGLPSGARSG